MKRHILTYCFLLTVLIGFSQEQTVQAIRHRSDSLLQLLKTAEGKARKEDLIIEFYSTSIDGFPLLILELGQQLLTLGREKKDMMIEAAAWSALGQGYRLTGNHAKALEMHQKAIDLAEQTGSNVIRGFAFNQMGHIYKDRLENEQAQKIYRTAMYYGTIQGDSTFWYPMMNLAVVKLAMGELDSSLYFADLTLRAMKDNRKVANHLVVQNTIGSVYSQKGELEKARQHFSIAQTRAVEIQSPRYLNTCYVALAEHFSKQGMYDSAAYFNRLATEAVQGTASNNLALRPARMLIDYYQNRNADSAVKYWRIYSAANDSLNSTKANQQIQMLTLEVQQRQWDIEQARKDARTKWQTIMLIGGLLSTILILTLVTRASQRRKKDNEKLSKAYSELRSTQQQLIQSEKMASLGELTAGIAHEIQNPLNFVNNFSQLNTELAAEGQEAISSGNLGDAEEVLSMLAENNNKILHHGKRADAIVKAMLEHSRSSSGVKEPSDINKLADEYLRLAYHGMRARDNSFNCDIIYTPDPGLGKVNIVPQDIGRVLLNLINNALYAVNEKTKLGSPSFKPQVTLSTAMTSDNALIISVSDNGNGIPEGVRNKIFQPFFTTKPTGEGTGLGLSLSYDIVKAHGGEISVESKEMEGTKFIISLPIS